MKEAIQNCSCGRQSGQVNFGLLLGGVAVGALAGLIFLPLTALFLGVLAILYITRAVIRWASGGSKGQPSLEMTAITQELSAASKK